MYRHGMLLPAGHIRKKERTFFYYFATFLTANPKGSNVYRKCESRITCDSFGVERNGVQSLSINMQSRQDCFCGSTLFCVERIDVVRMTEMWITPRKRSATRGLEMPLTSEPRSGLNYFVVLIWSGASSPRIALR